MKLHQFVIVGALVLSGCATQAPVQGYRPANHAGSPWQISGEYNEFSGNIVISVNGQKVAEGRMSILSGTAELAGYYDNKPVASNCSNSTGLFVSKTQCIVFIGNERAATLQF
jgi:hypothetical protein